jgi:hypothetical protein
MGKPTIIRNEAELEESGLAWSGIIQVVCSPGLDDVVGQKYDRPPITNRITIRQFCEDRPAIITLERAELNALVNAARANDEELAKWHAGAA